MTLEKYLEDVKSMIDDLKAMSASLGLSNTGNEYGIISELFTFKFLNDKLIHDFKNREDLNESFQDFVDFADSKTARIPEKFLIDNLFKLQNEPNFHTILDDALVTISELNKDIYSIETATGQKKPLFETLNSYIRDEKKENELAKRAINILKKYTFDNIYERGWDYFSSIFEYLIKDYNKDSGKYAEYFTPAFAGKIIAEILYNDTPVNKVTIYDPAAGSGTLLLSMANEIGVNNCTIYSQDISQKSTQFLRINLILNKLSHSLHNVIEGNTLVTPLHLCGDELRKFDFIVSNPPFNVDFSADVSTLEADKYDRFFAGIPNIPKKDLKSMAIYLPFLQHIISSLDENGKAAVVVPTGFLTAKKGIPKTIREKLVDSNWLTGAISMPSNIFANTTTSVSIIFIDKGKTDDNVFLMEANKIGNKVKIDDVQRTILTEDDEKRIVNTFKNRIEEKDFTVKVSNKEVKEKKYSFSAGQYFKVAIEYDDISQEEYENRIENYKNRIHECFNQGDKIKKAILEKLEEINFER